MGLVDKLKQEFDLHAEWLAFEIHPETPAEGMPLIKMFPRADVESMTRRLNSMGASFDLTFQKIVNIFEFDDGPSRPANSRRRRAGSSSSIMRSSRLISPRARTSGISTC